MLLVLFGMTLLGQSQAAEPAGRHATVAADLHSDHCPGPTHDSGPGQCCPSVHGHACCLFLALAADSAAAPTGQARGQPGETHFAGVVTAPLPHPPDIPVA